MPAPNQKIGLQGGGKFIQNRLLSLRSNELLAKKQIRFLRMYFDYTQDEFAHNIGVADRFEMSKIESEQSERSLDTDRQVRLRLFCAKLLKLKDLDTVLKFNEIDDSKLVEIPSNLLPEQDKAEEVMLKFMSA